MDTFNVFSVFSLLGGLAFFLYGMNVMSQGLEKMAGGKLERALKKVTKSTFKSLLFGAVVTIAIQSSSAMTVMLVGFVNSKIMELGQTIGIIMGSNVGTTLTAWILSLAGVESDSIFLQILKPSNFSPVVAFIGIVMIMIAKSQRKKDVGNVFLGFAILMFGMSLMSDAMSPLANMPEFADILVAFRNPLLGLLAGAVITGVIQSSAASVGILQALSLTGGITYGMAIPIIIGQNIGTCVTALLSSIGVNKNAKRVAVVHVYFNTIGAIVFLGLFYLLHWILNFAFVEEAIAPVAIAGVHSIFNLATTIMLLPFTRQLEWLARKTVKDEKEETTYAFLDERLLLTPSVAVAECKENAVAMARLVQDTVFMGMHLTEEYSGKAAKLIQENEDKIDQYEDSLGNYLMKLTGRELSKSDSSEVSKILHAINDFERIGDHASNLVKITGDMKERKLTLSKKAQKELTVLRQALTEVVSMSVTAYLTDDQELAREVEPLEEVIDYLCDQLKDKHIKRLHQGQCTPEVSMIYQEILNNFERVSDHCSNIAICVIQEQENDYDPHRFMTELSSQEKDRFQEQYKMYKKKYKI